MSTKTGWAPEYKIQLLVATKLKGVVITTSFFFHLSARPNKCSAAVPLETAVQYFAFNFFLSWVSNFLPRNLVSKNQI